MGTFLNPGKNAFKEAVRSEIYVDKTDMIRHLNAVVGTKQKYVSVSRPRRFGKSMAADMICAYYDRTAESRAVFEKTPAHSRDFSRELAGQLLYSVPHLFADVYVRIISDGVQLYFNNGRQ